MSPILLDTCAVIWTGNREKLAPGAVSALDESFDRNQALQVSPITAWELGLLVARGRYRFSMEISDWFDEYMLGSCAQLAALSPSEFIASSFLPGTPPSDPADRIIIATARQQGLRIMTRDKKILDYADAGHVNAIPC